MSDQAREPSQWAKDATAALLRGPGWGYGTEHDHIVAHIQSAIEDATAQKDQEIARLKVLLDEAVKTLSLYVNVPEATRIKEAWEKLKSQ